MKRKIMCLVITGLFLLVTTNGIVAKNLNVNEISTASTMEYTITGKVTEKYSGGVGIKDATVKIKVISTIWDLLDPKCVAETQTDQNGLYSMTFEYDFDDDYLFIKIVASKEGYKADSQDFDPKDSRQTLTFSLEWTGLAPSRPTVTVDKEPPYLRETEYTFSIASTDPDGHKLSYKIDWNDETETDWFGPFESGESFQTSHTWSKCVNGFDITVKDETDLEISVSHSFKMTDLSPEIPSKPKGPTRFIEEGKSYYYSTKTTDPEGDQIYYRFDMGAEIFVKKEGWRPLESDWYGPYKSGETYEVELVWPIEAYININHPFQIRVKAKSMEGPSGHQSSESDWSESLSIGYSKSLSKPAFSNILSKILDQLPILQRLIQKL